ncbi:MAG: right-handed parallel beta-helix repeat-containing protein [Rhodobacteraceae bacterium]|nr:right-handed parallel beta-helix repeat-containing protein [Paracoccaceae bacterium]
MIDSTASTAARTIRCLPGDYAGLNRGAALTKPGARTTVIAANRNQGGAARTRFLNVLSDMARLSGFTFDGLVFESTAKDALGYPHADSKAINWTDAANITLRNCTFKGHHRCVAIHRSDNLTVEWNEFTRIGMDSLSCFDTHTNLKIHNNHFHDLDVDASRATSDAPNRHPDGASCQGTSSRNIEWIGNSFFGPNAYWQGIFCANSTIVGGGDFNANAHDGVTIRKNWIVSRHSNGLFIAGARGVVCEDNVLRTLNTAPARPWASDTPKLVLATRVEGIVRRNVMPGGIAYRFNPPLAAILQRDTNVISTTATPANLPVPEPCGPYGYE